eukprot:TRINITY_DN7404_c0_g1_i16.p1 TRINITY_DN7404_c0_g1~~TRINITY_DN7404_c0_g1_i16.p1  ORF type:complete len:485 (-),score=160.73 TRINITY_DN7404_c0_g1_i16:589-2043(-)
MDMFKDLCCSGFARRTAEELAEQYGGEQSKGLVGGLLTQLASEGGNSEATQNLLAMFTGKQQMSLEAVAGMVSESGGEQLREHATEKGLDPSLLDGVMNLVKGMKSGGGDGTDDGGSKFDPSMLLGLVAGLTKGGASGAGGGCDGFLQLLGGSGDGSSMGNIMQILEGLAKSFFNIKGKSSPAIQSWQVAGAAENANDKNFVKWALSVLMDLLFPGRKPKEVIEEGGDNDIDTGDKKDDGDVKGWFDGHPEIGKMQKDVFDDIFDTGDDDQNEDDDPSPIVPMPTDYEDNCSCLDNAAILFLNSNLLLEYRKNWRFLYSSRNHSKSLNEMMERICYKGPTILVVKDTSGNIFGCHASTSWIDTEEGWVGNGECFLFSISPKMAVFHSTGKDENFQKLSSSLLAMGGQAGCHGLELADDLASGDCNANIDTFHTIQLSQDKPFEIEHVEVWGLGAEPDMDSEKRNVRPRQPNLQTRGGNVDMLDA